MSVKDLAALRKEARLTQADLAQSLDITQAQVSKYEANGEIPSNLLRAWARALGCTIDELLPLPLEEEETIFDFDSSLYGSLTEDLNLLLQYIDRFPHLERLSDESVSPTVGQFHDRVIALKEKPWVVLTGHFDAGKSHLCNFYLGGDQLPTGYRPVTRFPTFVHHISDRPQWFKEDLWLMGPEFDPERWGDEQHCTKNRLLAGSWDTLRTEGHLKGRKDNSEEGAVLAFIDAPLLHSCVLLDLPGYDDEMTNASVIDRLGRRADVLLYLCPAQGFIDGRDLARLSHLLRNIPHYRAIDENFPILGNLFIIASHAHPGIKISQLEDEILKGGSEAFYKHLEGNLLKKLSSHGRPISSNDVDARFFSFYQEDPIRRKKLEKELKDLLEQKMPSIKRVFAGQEILKFKEEGTAIYAQAISGYEKILRDKQEARSYYERLEMGEPERKKNHDKEVTRIKKKITAFKEEDLKKIRAIFEEETKVEKLEAMIKRRYKDKKDAHKYASSYVLEEIQSKTASRREKLMIETHKLIDEFVEGYNIKIGKFGNANIEEGFSTPFDAKGVFIGGLAGLGTLGALGAWAATLGNLGGYVIVAKGVSALSAMGISVAGGTAGAAALVSALGGPITLALGVAIAVGASFKLLFGDSWQLRLAKKIKGLFDEKNVLSSIEKNSESFWKETLTAFNKGADNLDKQHKKYIKELKDAFEGSQEDLQVLEKRVERYEEIKNFFATIPWRFRT